MEKHNQEKCAELHKKIQGQAQKLNEVNIMIFIGSLSVDLGQICTNIWGYLDIEHVNLLILCNTHYPNNVKLSAINLNLL